MTSFISIVGNPTVITLQITHTIKQVKQNDQIYKQLLVIFTEKNQTKSNIKEEGSDQPNTKRS